jgi:citrate lyase subunit beta/citryl-CoA lyase
MQIEATTVLFVPADRPDRIGKALVAGADIVVVDLEDAVTHERRAEARANLRTLGVDLKGAMVRVNALTTVDHAADMELVKELGVGGIMLAKAEELPEHWSYDGEVIALVETAAGLANTRSLLRARQITRLAFGSIDFAADLGCAHTREALLLARSELVLASRLAGIAPPIDGVTVAFSDDAAAEDDARHAAILGFTGKLCIHPRQLDPVRRGFAPRQEEIAWAQSILAAAGGGAVTVDGAMVDEPVRKRALAILARRRPD